MELSTPSKMLPEENRDFRHRRKRFRRKIRTFDAVENASGGKLELSTPSKEGHFEKTIRKAPLSKQGSFSPSRTAAVTAPVSNTFPNLYLVIICLSLPFFSIVSLFFAKVLHHRCVFCKIVFHFALFKGGKAKTADRTPPSAPMKTFCPAAAPQTSGGKDRALRPSLP